MNNNPSKQTVLNGNPSVISAAIRKLVRERAFKVAVLNGRSAQQACKADWDQAKRELNIDPAE